MRRIAPRAGSGFARRYAWLAYLIGGVAAAGLFALNLSPEVDDLASAVIGLGAVVALAVGPRWLGARPLRPWLLLSLAALLFLVGVLVRPWAAVQEGLGAFAGDAFTVPGYVCMIIALVDLIRVRGSLERHAVTDGLIVGVGATLATVLLLAVPAASITDRATPISVMAGIYPLFDVVVLLVLVNLAFTTAVRQLSYLLLITMMVLLLAGDLSYAIAGVRGVLVGSRWMDLVFLLGFTAVGAAALHPSVKEISRAVPLPAQAWSWPRLLLIGPAVAVPFVLIPLLDDHSWSTALLLAAGGAAIVALLIFRAVSAVQDYASAQRRAEHQATHDQLTGLPNRTALYIQVDRMLSAAGNRAEQLWLFYLDLDGFKLVNDSWGHAAGDQLIAEVAARVREVMPAQATVARVGGDEFVVAVRGERDEAIAIADRLLECFSEPLQVRAAEVIISASVGIVGVPVDRTIPATAESLMRDADTAMYQAKSEGPGKWIMFDASMHERVRERVEIEYALRHAIGGDELRLVYQPIVDLRTGEIVGAEVLSRWEHPIRGAIPPTTFIPIAEDAGLIARLGLWVLQDSLRQLGHWRADGVVTDDFWLSVNVSPRQLRDASLPRKVNELLLRYRVPARAVVLEITESVMIDPSAVTDNVLFQLRALGLRIVVDDFGTGYSALGYLRRHPVTGVKIDRAFVGGLGSSAEDEEIVRAVVALSGAMGLTVVAEGVESMAQQEVLATLGVVLGQGLLWGAPTPPADFDRRWSVSLVGEAAQRDGSGS